MAYKRGTFNHYARLRESNGERAAESEAEGLGGSTASHHAVNIENWKHDAAAGAVPLTSPRCYIGYISLYSTHLLKPHR